MEANNVVFVAKKRAVRFGSKKHGLVVREKGWFDTRAPNVVKNRIASVKRGTARQVIGCQFAAIMKRARKDPGTRIFAATMADINKALEVKRKQTPEEIKAGLPMEIHENAQYFTEDENHEMPPHRSGVDTEINLQKDDNGKEKSVPAGPLYGMFREELLVLRKTHRSP